MNSKVLFNIVLLVITVNKLAEANFWDDFVEKINQGAEYVKNEAAPAVVEKFEQAKTAVVESEVPSKVQTWFEEVCIYFVKHL